MQLHNKATRINLFNLASPQMRAFHMSWFAFFLCFFAWFGVAPLMKVVRAEMNFTDAQVGWCIIGSVSITVVARLFIGWLCDRIGPRLAYTWLLILGSLPVMGIAFAQNFETFLLFRVLIGVIGASFVITQYHTSLMFAPNCVGTANATSAGWGVLGGGVTQMMMPLIFAGFVGALGLSNYWGWRAAMVTAGVLCMLTGVAYYLLTQDAPDGNFKDLRAAGKMPTRETAGGSFRAVCADPRVWALFVIYGACFGIDLTINSIAALYFVDYFEYFQNMDTLKAVQMAGLFAGLFGLMNVFGRTLGGHFSDRLGARHGLKGRVRWLFAALLCEGVALMAFSQQNVLAMAIPALIALSLFVQMSEGATFAVVPFINKRALGSVAGIVGAGGNAGAVAAGFLFKGALDWPTALLILGCLVTVSSFLTLAVRFSPQAETEARTDVERAVARRRRPELAGVVD
ncbi:MAG: MFS transporter [Planctomycetaceae bacterium]|nr:MFS transporter [Planctomycetaceae bacterium]